MRNRIFWSFFTVTAILCFLFSTNSRGGEAVDARYTATYLPAADAADDASHLLTAKTHLASGCYGVSRRQQLPAPFSDRQPGYAHLPEFPFHWQTALQRSGLSLSYDAGSIFISRIRRLLYPKHSFW